MPSIQVTHSVGGVSRDLRGIAMRAPRDFVGAVRSTIRHGERTAQTFARRSAGAHGKHYPRSITSEMLSTSGAISGEWGPDPGLPQGGMSFEQGSRNQPAHNDLGRSAAVAIPFGLSEVQRIPGRHFW